jgi:hypothetical protein
VRSMRPIQGEICGDVDVVSVSASSLSRHVSSISYSCFSSRLHLSPEGLRLLSMSCLSLTRLWCEIGYARAPHASPYLFSSRLEELILITSDRTLFVRGMHGISKCAAALRSLKLLFEGRGGMEGSAVADFDSLQALSRLMYLEIGGWNVSAAQVNSVRRMPSLIRFDFEVENVFTSQQLCAFLTCPTEQRLQTFSTEPFEVDDAAGAALGTLTNVTNLTISRSTLTDVAWFASLSSLVVLRLRASNSGVARDAICIGLASIPQLTELDLHVDGFTSRHMANLPVLLPRLKKLVLWSVLDPSFFPSLAALAQTLHTLHLFWKRSAFSHNMRRVDLEPLHALVHLKHLKVSGPNHNYISRDPLYNLPSTVMPSLETAEVLY